MGITLKDLALVIWLTTNFTIHLWTQEYTSFGGALECSLCFHISPQWPLILLGRWKSSGYIIGLQLHEGFSFMGGIQYKLSP